jgi:hypothetical protein
MGSITLIGGGIVFGLAFISNPKQTIALSSVILTARGVTFLAKRMTQTMNKDASDIIDFAGWSIAGVSIIKLLQIAMSGFTTVGDSINKIQTEIASVGQFFERIAQWADKITFWN